MSNLQKNRMIPLEELTLMDRFLLSEAVEDQQFFEDPSEEVAKRSHSDRIMRMQQHVKSLKSNADVRVRFMNAWEEREYAKQEGRAEGLAEGERRMTALYALLKETSRLEDYGKAMEDTAFREQLYAELGL